MQRFDRYVLFAFLIQWVVVACAFLGLFSVLEILGKADEFQEALAMESLGISGGDIFYYYMLNLPFLLLQFAPYITLIAGLGTVAQLLRNREWTPILVAGRATWRAFLPIFFAAGLISFGLGLFRETHLPNYLRAHESLQRQLFNQIQWQPLDLWTRGEGDVRLHAARFIPGDKPVINGLEVFALDASGKDERVLAKRAVWESGAWQLTKGVRIYDKGEEPIARYFHAGLAPRDLERSYFAHKRPLELSAVDLKALLKGDPDHRQAETLLWGLRIWPLIPLILLALGLPFALSFERRSSLEGVATGLLLCAFYFVIDLLMRDFGGRGALSPWLAGTAPVLFFGSLGLWSFGRMPN
ncbi:MAG: LptF/LptG family permease [Planctomycetota bacterium]